MKKLQKILMVLIVFFIGTISVKGEDQYCEEVYNKFENAYKALAAVTEHYYSSAIISADFKPKDVSIEKLCTEYGINESFYLCNDVKKLSVLASKDNVTSLELLLTIFEDAHIIADRNSVPNEDHNIGDNGVINEFKIIDVLSSFSDLDSILGGMNKQVRYIAKVCGPEYEHKHIDTNELINSEFSDICSFLGSKSGVQYYVKMILRILKYISLALALILSTLEFIKAITSHDDAALTKAFQSLMKRLAAVVVIFVVTVIVQLFLGLITAIPGVEANQLQTCNILNDDNVEGNN